MTSAAHHGCRHERSTAFDELASRRGIARRRGQTDQHRCHRDDAERVRCEPVVPSGQDRSGRVLEEDESEGPADPRDSGPDDRRRQQSEHMAQPAETEARTEIVLDEARREQRFPGIAQGEDDRAQGRPVAQQIGHDGCDHRPGRHRPSRAWSERDQDAGGNARGRPEHGHAIGFGQQRKTEPRRQEIGDTDRERERTGAQPPPLRIDGGEQLMPDLLC